MTVAEKIQAWIDKGDSDLGAAKIIYLHLPKHSDIVGFHCQQSVEKYLKAYLIYLDVEFLPKHDIGYLINLIATKDSVFEVYYEQAIKLTEYSVKIRYPDIVIHPTKDELEEAIKIADLFREMLCQKINIK